VPLSRQQRANSTFRIPAGSADRLHEDSYIVEWPGTVDYFEAVEAPSLGHVRPVDFAEKVLEYIAGVFSA
jgi:hypothetical protein